MENSVASKTLADLSSDIVQQNSPLRLIAMSCMFPEMKKKKVMKNGSTRQRFHKFVYHNTKVMLEFG
jgi:hypothetical protein